MDIQSLRKAFLEYFSSQGYKAHEASSLIPENDPSVLFTTAGMQQFKPYYTHPDEAPNKRLSTAQPVIRTSDIAEVGDDTHLTMFEMLGIFSFGERNSHELKKDAITAMWNFVHQELDIPASRIFATVFEGDDKTQEDTQSTQIWHELGVEVRKMGRDDNFWGPTGDEGPCGPNTEVYVDGIEIGNLVFNQYYQDAEGNFKELDEQGLDFGGGLERMSTILQGQDSVWKIEPFKSWVKEVGANDHDARIIIDHLKAVVFLISEGIIPANKGREYILRRLIRKAIFLTTNLEQGFDWEGAIEKVRSFYVEQYELINTDEILKVLLQEKSQFEKNLLKATTYLDRWLKNTDSKDEKAITELAFYMYESFGFPKELVIEYLKGINYQVDTKRFEELFKKHQEVSRAGLGGQFKGGLADHEPQTIKHHTAHHLLLAALQQVLGKDIVQRGSNVNSERLRIDFNFDRKISDEELRKVEDIVNEKIKEDLPVVKTEMDKDEALKSGAQAEFGQKYGEKVTVYSIGDFSKELCGGPHVTHTGELGHFEILKEEASSQGIRRIKAKVS